MISPKKKFSNLSAQKVKKFLVSARVYQSDTVNQVNELYSSGLSITEIQERTGLSIASINTCIPYGKVVYKMSETSVDADRARLFRQRQKAVERVKKSIAFGEENLKEAVWDAIVIFAGYPFKTMKGLRFTYKVYGGEIFFSGKEKRVTRATVDLAIDRIIAARSWGESFEELKDIGVFGDSYLFPVLGRVGVCE